MQALASQNKIRRGGLRTYDQPAADVVGLVPGRERGEGHLGDFGVSDQALFLFVPDRVRVVDRGPCRLLDARDRFDDSAIHSGGDREPGAAAAGGGDAVVGVVRAVGAFGDQPAPKARLGGGKRRAGGTPRYGVRLPLRSQGTSIEMD